MQPIKPQKNTPKATLKDLNQDRNTLDREKRNPVHFYNTKIRKEGQPILSELEYRDMISKKFRKMKDKTEHTNFIIVEDDDIEVGRQYPLTPDQAYPPIEPTQL